QVRQVDRRGAATEPFGLLGGEEVHALDQHVRRRDERTGRALEDGGVVPGSDDDRPTGRKQRSQAVDEPVLGGHARGAGGDLRRDVPVTGISRGGFSGRDGAGAGSGAASVSAASSAIASTSSMLST